MKHLKAFVIMLFLTAMTCTAQQPADSHLQFDAFPEKTEVKSGEEVKVLIWMKVDKDWHTYPIHEQLGSAPTEFAIKQEGTFEKIETIYTKVPKEKYDSTFQSNVQYYKRKAYFILELKALRDIDFADETIELAVKAQQCDDETCLDGNFVVPVLPEVAAIAPDMIENSRKYTVTYDPEMGYPIAEYEKETPTESEEVSDEQVPEETEEVSDEDKSLWGLIITAMFNGLVSIFMPCVFPMIPITVSFFLKRSEEGGSGLRDATTYALGIIFTFTLFGAIIAMLIRLAGFDLLSLVATPWFNAAIVVLFVFFALSLLGAYEIKAPSGITNKLDAKSRKGSGVGSILLMALVFVLVSFSCTGPFISAALVSAIEHGTWTAPLISMVFFSAVLASPFFFLALSPKALANTKAGAWMNNIKIVLGFLVLALSTKYFHTALAGWGIEVPRNIILSFYAAASLIATLYILGVWKSKYDAPVDSLGVSRILFSILFAIMTFYFVSGFSGRSMGFMEGMLPARSQSAVMAMSGGQAAAIEWGDDYEKALAQAKEEGKNVFIDFTGINCTNCKKMENDMFPRPAVIEAVNQYVPVKLYTDKRGEKYKKNKSLRNEKFKSYANPLYVIVTPEGEEIARENYQSDEEKFLEFLAKGVK